MKKFKRIFLIILDSFGIGAAPDATDFGDGGASTLGSISKSKKFNIPNLLNLGFGNIDGVGLGSENKPKAAVARLKELSNGKDTTVGHWEICGITSESPLPTYENGFPDEIISEFEKRTGKKALCNKPYSGTEVIKDFGDEQVRSKNLIVYTSADSVFQIAAHENVIPPEELYGYCRIAREILVGKHGVGRVIARPFIGESGSYVRTANRRDFSLKPPKKTALDAIKKDGLTVTAIGKINDIFAGEGISEWLPSHSNTEGIELTLEVMKKDFRGLCFTNLVDFDMLYGHRQDVDGYAAALAEFDTALPKMLRLLGEDDALIITADHGCDPGDKSTDHTREYVPLIIYGSSIAPKNLGTLDGFATVGKAVSNMLGVDFECESGVNLSDLVL